MSKPQTGAEETEYLSWTHSGRIPRQLLQIVVERMPTEMSVRVIQTTSKQKKKKQKEKRKTVARLLRRKPFAEIVTQSVSEG